MERDVRDRGGAPPAITRERGNEDSSLNHPLVSLRLFSHFSFLFGLSFDFELFLLSFVFDG